MFLPVHQNLVREIARHVESVAGAGRPWTYRELFSWMGHPVQFNNAVEALMDAGYLTQAWNTGRLDLTKEGRAWLQTDRQRLQMTSR